MGVYLICVRKLFHLSGDRSLTFVPWSAARSGWLIALLVNMNISVMTQGS